MTRTAKAEVELVGGRVIIGQVQIAGQDINERAIRFFDANNHESLIPWTAIVCLTYLKD